MTVQKNKVISPYCAIIDGKQTGLAGCVRKCENCIRGDSALKRPVDFGNPTRAGCRYFIPY